jgi:hypothetical protein
MLLSPIVEKHFKKEKRTEIKANNEAKSEELIDNNENQE